ncbi:MAG: transposase, partial [Melioribacteraceae bacterium]|nr:transposase [Melioribacteraceae bacterium]
MSIFQKSVVNKHLANLDKGQVEKAYQKFRENYNSAKIKEIKNLKEEEYQYGFLRDIFVDVLGYILKPNENYNLAREFKNQGDSKKADGAIVTRGHVPLADKAIAVIELKSTKTKDLKRVTEQAFGYKHNQPDCKYVIISNFQKLQFYIDYANEYEEFDLIKLQRDEFELLYLLLNSESIFSDLPLKLKTETKFHEENVSNELYKDYSIFKRKLFENLIKNNPDYDKLTLFKKSQKLLDRFLFILFAEDSGLLPPNSNTRVIDTFKKLEELDAYKAIYEIYKQYFGYLNIGRKGKTEADKIPSYNGGLFYPDELLDNLIIDDEILISDLLKLSEYDFNTEVDVNILGHIFEHSLNEIEEITAKIAATAATRGHVPLASKRKKDGVFYTPKYITQYIVENTVGTLCKEKRKEFEILEIEIDNSFYKKTGKNSIGRVPLSEKGKKLFETLEKYKEWLLTLKIVDPACGSGAFLNQALNFLIAEHKSIDDIIAELTNTPLRLFDTEKSILENNLYGVDINEESVEIAKLSLWLRTARKDRKLSNLNNNIKCGNSLIDDPEVAGDKAFNWNKEFPQIFREKIKQAWHITTATHNSRYSQRMFDNHIKLGEPIWLSERDEIVISQAVSEIIKESKEKNEEIYFLEYNICGDHLHMLLVCEKEEVSKIVGKIKAVTARKYNIEKGITTLATSVTRGHVPLSREDEPSPSSSSEVENLSSSKREKKKYNSLWTQKFGKSEIKDKEYLRNAISYIRNNRKKHELPENKELEKIVAGITCTLEHAFRTEYSGGFDVVIGNPPYVRHEVIKEYKPAFQNSFKTYLSTADLYVYFIELGVR